MFRLIQSELEFTYVRSPGPGGQNVNKRNTKAVLRFQPQESSGLTPDQKRMIKAALPTRTEIVISSSRFRSQGQNAQDCIDKLRNLLTEILRPRKKRKKTKVPASRKRARLETKKRRSEIKKFRKPV